MDEIEIIQMNNEDFRNKMMREKIIHSKKRAYQDKEAASVMENVKNSAYQIALLRYCTWWYIGKRKFDYIICSGDNDIHDTNVDGTG